MTIRTKRNCLIEFISHILIYAHITNQAANKLVVIEENFIRKLLQWKEQSANTQTPFDRGVFISHPIKQIVNPKAKLSTPISACMQL